MVDNKLAQEEAQRTATYEAVKTDVQSEVGGEIAYHAERASASRADIRDVAQGMREKAVNEVVQTEQEIERGRVMARISQVVDYVFFVVYGLLTLRFLLELFGAREGAGFFKFIVSVTNPIYAPFKGLMASPSADGFTLALPVVFAIVAYMLLHLAINGLLRIFAHRKVSV